MYDPWPGMTDTDNELCGLVTAWGNVELHPDGFRSEYARVAALVDTGPVAQRMAGKYGVPLITIGQFANDRFISEFGQVVPPEMRPPRPIWDGVPTYGRLSHRRSPQLVLVGRKCSSRPG